ncbi:peptidylprolyl isomerase domain and WD repeat-containing protein 1-like isoform X2 [Lingula anatina]|uniref:peptidylprolyl isomerase n=1 Tax=Lingula anatina TaxID=7574 RepID=A0A1S3ITM9_LINAN|nr:peptidylprolyl isomerase domain and WD repeat-containing protein 1-like isoform X1 [Lingula anatina]XP_013401439.1 peptidylprolyl isomerase domain and WD repeat-containing protein 1-like isoform X2 [Lingula anatina]|eukprot:XP_013401438.1 peptidylprolyl isomerase domain and WD repeat-containing protein 1-like isoform X1 [Lingula anatina]
MAESVKRSHDDEKETGDADEWIGPMPEEAAKPKKRKVLEFEQVYLDSLPCAESYERSFMHRDVLTHVEAARTEFVVTSSVDGHVKFWKKKEDEGIEFVKHYRGHLGSILDMAVSPNGELCCTIADDKTLKVFDVINFDMINMLKLSYVPHCCSWIYAAGDAIPALAVSEKGNKIYIYDGRGSDVPIETLEKIHYKQVVVIKYNPVYEVAVSADESGMVEYWTGPKSDYNFPKNVSWEYKTDTDLYEFAKCQTVPTGVTFSPNGKLMATIAKDRKVRIFKFATGKLYKVLDESLKTFTELQQTRQQLPNMEFGRRMAVERDLEKSDAFSRCNVLFDSSGNFIMYGTMLGIKVINLYTNQCVRFIGKPENIRFVHLSLFQGSVKGTKAALSAEMEASDNPSLQEVKSDPTLFCTAFKKNRFYMFTRREPDSKSADAERDIFNERPSKEDIVAATQDASYTRVASTAVIYTTMGDIHIKLFPKECPKTVENFCVHSRNGYYNGHIFHRVIKGFMIQTGDPLGTGTGGESIWGGEFEDEFHPSIRHDRPYTLSMANAGANTNGSQFFVTVVPTPWLDNKHTVFGRVVKGMEVVQNISNVKCNPKTDKPHDDVRIISISCK